MTTLLPHELDDLIASVKDARRWIAAARVMINDVHDALSERATAVPDGGRAARAERYADVVNQSLRNGGPTMTTDLLDELQQLRELNRENQP